MPQTATAQSPVSISSSTLPRGLALSPCEHRAVVLIERTDSGTESALPIGWECLFANARLSDLFEHMFARGDAAWHSMLLPEEQHPTFSSLMPADMRVASIVGYNGQLRLNVDLPAHAAEPVIVLVNGRQFPMCDISQAIRLHRQGRADATFFELADSPVPAYQEKLHMHPDGRVERVSRIYGQAAPVPESAPWPALVILSRPAMKRLGGINLPQKLEHWPSLMLRAGLKAAGLTMVGRSYDLNDRNQLHELADAILRFHPQWLGGTSSLYERSGKVYIGRNVIIPESAQMIGPVAIGDETVIGEDCVIVGPTVIGRGSRIENGAILRRCLVQPNPDLGSQSIHSPGLPAQAFQADRPIRLQSILEAPSLWAEIKHIGYHFTKRGIDLLGSLLFILCSIPFYPFIALAIKINSPGPVFYGHIRQGRGGRNFKCWKFRTMIPDAEAAKIELLKRNEVDGPQFKMKDDPRIFFVGKWLRKLNMDEWPQFFNVLLGQMSLVGPRPSPEKENQMCPAWRDARLSVRPGITGLWQVCRKREGDTDFQEWIYYDVQYVKKQSIAMDLKILIKTFAVALKGS